MIEKRNKQIRSRRSPATIAELQALTVEDWRDWFCDGVDQWFSIPENEEGYVRAEPEGQIRREAFRPLIISARSLDSVGDLAAELKQVLGARRAWAARGLGMVIDDWQIESDGAKAGAFIVSLANALRTPHLVKRLVELFQRRLGADKEGRRRLIGEAVNAARDRGTVAEAEDLFQTMIRADWMEAGAAARLLPKIARGNLAKLALLMARDVPELARAESDSGLARSLARAMRYSASWVLETDQVPTVDGYERALSLLDQLRSRNPEAILTSSALNFELKLDERIATLKHDLARNVTVMMNRLADLVAGNDVRSTLLPEPAYGQR